MCMHSLFFIGPNGKELLGVQDGIVRSVICMYMYPSSLKQNGGIHVLCMRLFCISCRPPFLEKKKKRNDLTTLFNTYNNSSVGNCLPKQLCLFRKSIICLLCPLYIEKMRKEMALRSWVQSLSLQTLTTPAFLLLHSSQSTTLPWKLIYCDGHLNTAFTESTCRGMTLMETNHSQG